MFLCLALTPSVHTVDAGLSSSPCSKGTKLKTEFLAPDF